MKTMRLLVAIVAGVAVTGVTAASADAPLPSKTSDPVGDSGAAPDVSAITVSSTDSSAGILTFQVQLANRPAPPSDEVILVALDTDSNPATGGGGSEYALAYSGGDYFSFKWNGTSFVLANAPSFQGVYTTSMVSFQISAFDAGVGSSFGYRVVASSADDSAHDFVPDSSETVYNLVPPPPPAPAPPTNQRPRLTSASATRKTTSVTVRFRACDDSEGSGKLRAITRRASSSNVRLFPVNQLMGCNVYAVSWRLPKTKGTLAVSFIDAGGRESAPLLLRIP